MPSKLHEEQRCAANSADSKVCPRGGLWAEELYERKLSLCLPIIPSLSPPHSIPQTPPRHFQVYLSLVSNSTCETVTFLEGSGKSSNRVRKGMENCLKQYSSHYSLTAQAVCHEKMWWEGGARSHSLLPPAGNILDGDLWMGEMSYPTVCSGFPTCPSSSVIHLTCTHTYIFGASSALQGPKTLERAGPEVFSANLRLPVVKLSRLGTYSTHPCLGTNWASLWLSAAWK